MPINIVVAGAAQPVQSIKVLAGGSLRPAKAVKIMAGGQLRNAAVFAGSLSVSASGDAIGANAGDKPFRVTSNTVLVTPSGGLSPYGYSWAIVAGEFGITITAPTMAATAFRQLLGNETITATARCTVTDAYGSSAFADIEVTLTQEGP